MRKVSQAAAQSVERKFKSVLWNVAGSGNLLIPGQPGIGKTYEVTNKLDELDVPYHVVKGRLSPPEFYKHLFNHNIAGSVLVLDECDDVLKDPRGCNLIKGACETGGRRFVQWNVDNKDMIKAGIPKEFDVHVRLILMCNEDIGAVINQKKKGIWTHLDAICSRVKHLPLFIDDAELFARVATVWENSMKKKLCGDDQEKARIMWEFFLRNHAEWKDKTLRLLEKMNDDYGRDDWQDMFAQSEMNYADNVQFVV